MQTNDPYAVLGVAPDATQAEISSAFRRLVREHHPDLRNGPTPDTRNDRGSTDLGRILSAYALLRDPDRRADHDRQQRRTAPSNTAAPIHPVPTARRRRPAYRQPPIQAGPVLWQPAQGRRGTRD
jgi:molecular chaperone DnaJ